MRLIIYSIQGIPRPAAAGLLAAWLASSDEDDIHRRIGCVRVLGSTGCDAFARAACCPPGKGSEEEDEEYAAAAGAGAGCIDCVLCMRGLPGRAGPGLGSLSGRFGGVASLDSGWAIRSDGCVENAITMRMQQNRGGIVYRLLIILDDNNNKEKAIRGGGATDKYV